MLQPMVWDALVRDRQRLLAREAVVARARRPHVARPHGRGRALRQVAGTALIRAGERLAGCRGAEAVPQR